MKLRHDMLTHGVNIVTAQHEGKRGGLAVAWATQVGTKKVIICVGRQSTTRPLILASKAFGLSVLAKDQLPLARKFGKGASTKTDKFAGVPFHTAETGSPLLDDCILWFDCRVENVIDVDEVEKLIVGRIIDAGQLREKFEPLIYRQEDY